mgnify:CR=1 FL=1
MTEQQKKHDRSADQSADTAVALGKGLDVGTANLAAAVQNDEGGITVTVERNAFLDIPSDVYSKNMLTKLKVPYVVHNGKLVVIGEAAFELANVFGRETRRPMSDGLISPNEQDALPMMKMIISKLLGEPRVPGESCYFCVPAPSLDVDNNVVYHQGLFESLVAKMGYTAHAINEARSANVRPWKPRTRAAAMRLPRYGSSPEPSAIRPHRGSRAMSTIGANVQ